ncbi:hypothetical protein Pcinc_001742 [Petrolisthes cinctipes]|uniref:Uncharacterized protein n=1 Tax=Petrolisthes cinctipes TaxID=88211 RepID=A0AAE1L2X9_PETCI|nr:hypothetical protein Pcinc_001742 [Petrolisthes cinctipes]
MKLLVPSVVVPLCIVSGLCALFVVLIFSCFCVDLYKRRNKKNDENKPLNVTGEEFELDTYPSHPHPHPHPWHLNAQDGVQFDPELVTRNDDGGVVRTPLVLRPEGGLGWKQRMEGYSALLNTHRHRHQQRTKTQEYKLHQRKSNRSTPDEVAEGGVERFPTAMLEHRVARRYYTAMLPHPTFITKGYNNTNSSSSTPRRSTTDEGKTRFNLSNSDNEANTYRRLVEEFKRTKVVMGCRNLRRDTTNPFVSREEREESFRRLRRDPTNPFVSREEEREEKETEEEEEREEQVEREKEEREEEKEQEEKEEEEREEEREEEKEKEEEEEEERER